MYVGLLLKLSRAKAKLILYSMSRCTVYKPHEYTSMDVRVRIDDSQISYIQPCITLLHPVRALSKERFFRKKWKKMYLSL